MATPLHQTRSKPVFAILITFIIALAAGIIIAWATYPFVYKLNAKNSSAQTSIRTASQPANTSATEQVAANLTLAYTPVGQVATSTQPLSVSLTVPKILRTQITNSDCSNGNQGGPAGQGSVLAECLHLSFADSLGSGHSLNNSSSLSLWDTYDWLQRDEDTSSGPYATFNLATKAQKQKAMQTLASLTPTPDLQAVIKYLPSFAIDACYCQGIQKPTYIQSKDGTLKGVAFAAIVAQGVSYNPYIYVIMGGTIGNQPLLITGQFRASDSTVTQLESLDKNPTQNTDQLDKLTEQADDQFKAGNLSSQTLSSLSQVQAIMQSLTATTP